MEFVRKSLRVGFDDLHLFEIALLVGDLVLKLLMHELHGLLNLLFGHVIIGSVVLNTTVSIGARVPVAHLIFPSKHMLGLPLSLVA